MTSPRRASRALLSSCAVAALVASACSSVGDADDRAAQTTRGTGPELATGSATSLSRALVASATRTGVPRDLLVAIAVVEEGLRVPATRDVDVTNEVPAAGPLQLRRGRLDTLARGAALVGASELDLRRDGDLALEAGARVLAELGARTGAKTDDLASWSAAIAELSGFSDEAHRESYVHDVFRTLARGGRFAARGAESVALPAHPELPPSLVIDLSSTLRIQSTVAQYAGAEWVPTSCTNKCTTTRDQGPVDRVIIHDTEGSWNASLATLQNDPGKSAHYLVGEDGRIAQFVTEATAAWHCGNRHYNHRSIGIEHVGFHDQPFPEAEYAASAALVQHLLAKYAIPKDRKHVIGHDQVPNGNRIAQTSPPCSQSPKACQASVEYGGASAHVDPGIWEWGAYMARFGGTAKCNDVTAIWNCSDDRSRAFRCAGGKVEVVLCESCEVKPTGQDDVCVVKPQTAPPAPAPPAPEGAAPTENVAETTGAPLPVETGTGDEDDVVVDASAEVGCAVVATSATRTAAARPVSTLAVLTAIALFLGRRRRRVDLAAREPRGTGSTHDVP